MIKQWYRISRQAHRALTMVHILHIVICRVDAEITTGILEDRCCICFCVCFYPCKCIKSVKKQFFIPICVLKNLQAAAPWAYHPGSVLLNSRGRCAHGLRGECCLRIAECNFKSLPCLIKKLLQQNKNL